MGRKRSRRSKKIKIQPGYMRYLKKCWWGVLIICVVLLAILLGYLKPELLGNLIRDSTLIPSFFTPVDVSGEKDVHAPPLPASSSCPAMSNRSQVVSNDEGDGIYLHHKFSRFFGRHYDEMDKNFKVYIYPDGDQETYYHTPRKLTGKYASEGYFFQNIRESHLVTNDSDVADMFFIPISCHKMRGKGLPYKKMTRIIRDYVDNLIVKYPYWNRSHGADHFLVSCLEGGMRAIEGVPSLTKNSIRVTCASSIDLGFIRYKDVSLPQVLLPLLLPRGGNDLENRRGLAFWSGYPHNQVRKEMAFKWKDDAELDVSNSYLHMLRGQLSSHKFLKNKFCICPRGYVYNTPCIAEAIHYGCVPVILSDLYTLPFSTTLDWRKFSIAIKEKNVLNLKNVLKRISDSEFALLHENLLKVQKYFQWNTPPVKYDAFHMVMYELWIRRLQ